MKELNIIIDELKVAFRHDDCPNQFMSIGSGVIERDVNIPSTPRQNDGLPGSIDDLAQIISSHKEETFAERFSYLLEKHNTNCNQLSCQIGTSRQALAKILNYKNPTIPKKKTIIKIALALELNLKETKQLLSLAACSFNYHSYLDDVIKYCIDNCIYEYYRIEEICYALKQKQVVDVIDDFQNEDW